MMKNIFGNARAALLLAIVSFTPPATSWAVITTGYEDFGDTAGVVLWRGTEANFHQSTVIDVAKDGTLGEPYTMAANQSATSWQRFASNQSAYASPGKVLVYDTPGIGDGYKYNPDASFGPLSFGGMWVQTLAINGQPFSILGTGNRATQFGASDKSTLFKFDASYTIDRSGITTFYGDATVDIAEGATFTAQARSGYTVAVDSEATLKLKGAGTLSVTTMNIAGTLDISAETCPTIDGNVTLADDATLVLPVGTEFSEDDPFEVCTGSLFSLGLVNVKIADGEIVSTNLTLRGGAIVGFCSEAQTELTYEGNFPTIVPANHTFKYVGGETADNTVLIPAVIVNGTLKTSGHIAITNLTVASGASLEVLDGNTIIGGSSVRQLEGNITIDAGATLTNTRTDTLDYYGSMTVDIYGTLAMGYTRWSIPENCRFNLHAGARVNGSGDEYGALDLIRSTGNGIDVYGAGDNVEGSVTIEGPVRIRYENTRFWIAKGMTLILEGGLRDGWEETDCSFRQVGPGTMEVHNNSLALHGGNSIFTQGTLRLVDTTVAFPVELQNSNSCLEIVATDADTTVPVEIYCIDQYNNNNVSFSGAGKVSGKIYKTAEPAGDLLSFLQSEAWEGTLYVNGEETDPSNIVVNVPVPIAVWVAGEFDDDRSAHGGLEFALNGNTTNALGQIVIGSDTTLGATVAIPAATHQKMTMLVQYSMPSSGAPAANSVPASMFSSCDLGALAASGSSALEGYWYTGSAVSAGGYYPFSNPAQTIPQEGYILISTWATNANPNDHGTAVYSGESLSTLSGGEKSGLRFTGADNYITSVGVGGPTVAGAVPWAGMVIKSVALFDEWVTPSDLANYTFPAQGAVRPVDPDRYIVDPVASWVNDFKTTTKGDYTLSVSGTTAAKDDTFGGTLTIGDAAAVIDTTAANSANMTVLIKYRAASSVTTAPVVAFGGMSAVGLDVGVYTKSDKTLAVYRNFSTDNSKPYDFATAPTLFAPGGYVLCARNNFKSCMAYVGDSLDAMTGGEVTDGNIQFSNVVLTKLGIGGNSGMAANANDMVPFTGFVVEKVVVFNGYYTPDQIRYIPNLEDGDTVNIASGATWNFAAGETRTYTNIGTISSGGTIAITNAATLIEGTYKLAEWTTPQQYTTQGAGYGKVGTLVTDGLAEGLSARLIYGARAIYLRVDDTAKQTARKPLVVWCYGDSITEGYNAQATGANYRILLYQKLEMLGYNVRSTGVYGLSNGYNSVDPTGTALTDQYRWHSAKHGATAGPTTLAHRSNLSENVDTLAIQAGTPDVALLLIGVNDIPEWKNEADRVTPVFKAWTNVVSRMVKNLPDTKIVVSTILYSDGSRTDIDPTITAINTQIKNLFDNLPAEWQGHVVLADLNSCVESTKPGIIYSDHLHPDWWGYDQMADGYLEKIVECYPDPDATDFPSQNPIPAAPTVGQLGAANKPELAAYRAGFKKLCNIRVEKGQDVSNVQYGYLNGNAASENIDKVGYFVEFVRADNHAHKWVWVDMDAFGNADLASVGLPQRNYQQAVTKMHVCSNHGAIDNVAADDDSVTGWIEFSPYDYTRTGSNSAAPANYGEPFDWNDTLSESGSYGCMQVFRVMNPSSRDLYERPQLMFAFNNFQSQNSNPADFGIGNFAQHFNCNNSYHTEDWTGVGGTLAKMAPDQYSVKTIEIWTKASGEEQREFFSGRLADTPYNDGLGSNSSGRYRIPAIAKSTNDVIVAIYDCRYNGSGDLPSALDSAESWSGDGGRTWSMPRIGIDVPDLYVQTTTSNAKSYNFGDPCILFDPAGNKFWAMGITGGGLASPRDNNGNSISDVVLYTRGTGADAEWKEWTGGPDGNKRSVKQMILDALAEVDSTANSDENQIRGILQGPGHGMVQQKTVTNELGEVIMPAGALVFPMQYFSSFSNFNDAMTFAVYSTDGGNTWQSTKLTQSDQNAQENCVMELDDGSWYMICKGRTNSDKKRQLFRTTNYKDWTYCGSLTPSEWVQGSCLKLGRGADGTGRYVACFSPSGRSNITLYFGRDTTAVDPVGNGIEWNYVASTNIYPYSTGGMGYNSLVMLDDTTLGVLLETNGHIELLTVDVSGIVVPTSAVAYVVQGDNEYYYNTLTDAIAESLHGGRVITLLADVNEAYELPADSRPLKLNLNGHTWTGLTAPEGYKIVETELAEYNTYRCVAIVVDSKARVGEVEYETVLAALTAAYTMPDGTVVEVLDDDYNIDNENPEILLYFVWDPEMRTFTRQNAVIENVIEGVDIVSVSIDESKMTASFTLRIAIDANADEEAVRTCLSIKGLMAYQGDTLDSLTHSYDHDVVWLSDLIDSGSRELVYVAKLDEGQTRFYKFEVSGVDGIVSSDIICISNIGDGYIYYTVQPDEPAPDQIVTEDMWYEGIPLTVSEGETIRFDYNLFDIDEMWFGEGDGTDYKVVLAMPDSFIILDEDIHSDWFPNRGSFDWTANVGPGNYVLGFVPEDLIIGKGTRCAEDICGFEVTVVANGDPEPTVQSMVTVTAGNSTLTGAVTGSYASGTVLEFTVEPNIGYTLVSVTANGDTITPDGTGKYSVTVGEVALQIVVNTTQIDPSTMSELNERVADAGGSPTFSDSSVVVLLDVEPTDETKTFLKSDSWTGTVFIKDVDKTDIDPTAYGNPRSTLRLSGVKGYWKYGVFANSTTPAIELVNSETEERAYGFFASNGYSFYSKGSYNYVHTPELKGSGEYHSEGPGDRALLVVDKWDAFTGKLHLWGKAVWFGTGEPEQNSDTVALVRPAEVRLGSTIPANYATANWYIPNGYYGTVVMTNAANATETAFLTSPSKWKGTCQLNWNATGKLDIVNYGNANSVIEIPSTFSALPTQNGGSDGAEVVAEVKLTGNWTVSDGWTGEAYRTTFAKLSGAGTLMVNGANGGIGEPLPYTITRLEGFTGTIAGARGKFTFGTIVAATEPTPGTKLVNCTTTNAPVLDSTKVEYNNVEQDVELEFKAGDGIYVAYRYGVLVQRPGEDAEGKSGNLIDILRDIYQFYSPDCVGTVVTVIDGSDELFGDLAPAIYDYDSAAHTYTLKEMAAGLITKGGAVAAYPTLADALIAEETENSVIGIVLFVDIGEDDVPEDWTRYSDGGDGLAVLVRSRAIADTCVLRINEIMPKPTDSHANDGTEKMDLNGLESGWVEVENMSETDWADLADYRFIRVNRGKKTDPAGVGNFPERLVPPGGRAIFYTSERYSNSKDKAVSAFAHGTFDGKPMIMGDELHNILVWGDKVNPKKSPYVRLYYAPGGDSDPGTVVDTVVVPSDLPEGWSIIVGDAAEGEGTRRWMCPTPTRGKENTATDDLKRIGPNVGPLYEKKGQKKTDLANEFAVPTPPATPGEDYVVTLPINGVMNPNGTFEPREDDQILSIKFVYRKDLDDATLVTNDVNMATKATDENWGDQYSATIPASYFPAAGHLIQWKVLITDGEGVEWTSPSFNNPDDGYEWYGTIVEAPELESENLPTWHMFASGYHLTQMDVDKDDQNRNLVPNYARIAIYDSSTSNYYDYVRIDLRGNTSAGFTKKGHGLRFAKAHPLTMKDVVTGEDIEEIRKTSLISEYADPSYMRQMIAFWLFRKMGNLVPFDFPVRCNLNGEFYQLAFNSERFTDELIEDVYGLDKFGYGYKNVGTLKSGTGTTAGGIEKKTPDDEDESNITVLQSELRSKITAAQNVSSSPDRDDTGLDNAALTKFVVEKFDLPAWLNYLASARITHEMDDVWANVCAYYDNPEMKEGVRGTGTWMPLGYDFNLSFGQWYYGDIGGTRFGLTSTNDWYKSHPFYGGNRVKAYRNSSFGGEMNGNDGFEAVWQSEKFRRLYLRRLRTLMDQELKEPGTAEEDTPFMVKMREMANLMRADAADDTGKWGNDSSDNAIDVWTTENRPADMDAGIQDIWDNYVVPRREHLYVTHSATNTAKTVGYGSNLNAGIPEAQSPIETLAPNISISNLTALDAEQAEALGVEGQLYDTEVVVISNDNAEAVDMSGWRLAFSVDFTFPAGTVCDANDSIYIVADRRAYIDAHDAELTDQVIVGNATFTGAGPVALYDADGALVYSAIPQTDELKYLRLHSFYGNTLDGGDAGEWFTLTNISDTVTLDLADVTVCFLKQGDDHDTTDHCHVTLTNKKGKGDVKPLKSWTAQQADYSDKGWEKIQNNKQQITIYDKYGSVCQSLKVAQKEFPLAYGEGGWLVCDSTSKEVTKNNQWHEETKSRFDVYEQVNGHIEDAPEPGWLKDGTNFTIRAVADEHYHFVGWYGDTNNCEEVQTGVLAVNMGDETNGTSRAIGAIFAIDTFAVTFDEGEHGSLSGETTQTIDYGSLVNMDAVSVTADAGYDFVGWNCDIDASITNDVVFIAQYTERMTDTDYRVPYSWFAGYGIETEFETPETIAPNGYKYWQCYVLGLDPTNSTSKFTASVSVENNAPVITYSPTNETLIASGAIEYILQGRRELSDDWVNVPFSDPGNTNRYFQVKVVWDDILDHAIYSDEVANLPVNDNVADAIEITGMSGTATANNFTATAEDFENDLLLSGSTVWWKWTAPETAEVEFDTFGSDFDTILGVYTLTMTGFSQVVYNDESGQVDQFDESRNSCSYVAFHAEAGKTYYIAVCGWVWINEFVNMAELGDIKLNWSYASEFRFIANQYGSRWHLTGFTGVLPEEIVIPSEIDGHEIDLIDWMVFYNCRGLKKVTIPSSIRTLCRDAFDECRNLSTIVFEGDAPEVWHPSGGGGTFIDVADDCVAYIRNDRTGFNVDENGKWYGIELRDMGPFTVTFDSGEHGALIGASPSQLLMLNEFATVPDVDLTAGYEFIGWDGDVDAPVVSNATFTAQYATIPYNITYMGLMGASNPNPTTYTVEYEITFAAPGEVYGWVFKGWTPASIALGSKGDTEVTANWERAKFDVTVNGETTQYDYEEEVTFTAPEPTFDELCKTRFVYVGTSYTAPVVTNEFTVMVTNGFEFAWDVLATNWWFAVDAPEHGSIDAPDAGWMPDGTNFTLTAMPDKNYHFVGWTGDTDGCDVVDGFLQVTMDQPRTIGATFAIDQFTVTFEPGSHGALDGETMQTIDYGLAADTNAVSVTANDGYEFVGWDGDVAAEVTSNATFTAQYATIPYNITYTGLMGASNPNPTTYTVEDEITFAAPGEVYGWVFKGWTPASIALGSKGDTEVTANWERAKFDVTVNGETTQYDYEEEVTFTAPEPTFDELCKTRFVYVGTSYTAPVVTNEFTVMVTNGFEFAWDVLATNWWFVVDVPDNGSIIGAPEDGWMADGTNFTLTATAADHYNFVEWTGDTNDCEVVDGSLQVTMDQPRTIGATFAIDQFKVSFDAGDHGALSGETEQIIDYGNDATEPSVTPDDGYEFTGWSTSFTNITENLAVTAQYATVSYAIQYNGLKDGSVNSPDNPEIYTVEDAVTFVAPSSVYGWVFNGWAPASIALGTTGTVEVVANWVPQEFNVTVNGETRRYSYEAEVTFTAPEPTNVTEGVQIVYLGTHFTDPVVTNEFTVKVMGDISFGWDITATNYWFEVPEAENGAVAAPDAGWMPSGTNFTLTAVADDHYHFVGWYGDTNGCTVVSETELAVDMYQPRTIGAIFEEDPMTIGDAVEAPELNWVTSGDAEWFAERTESAQGGTTARSGAIGHGQESILSVTLEGAGILSFDWCTVFAEQRTDAVRLKVDGEYMRALTGTVDWTNVTVKIDTTGSHEVQWVFKRGRKGSVDDGSAAWLDNVVWTPEAELSIADAIGKDFEWETESSNYVNNGSEEGTAVWTVLRKDKVYVAPYEGDSCAIVTNLGNDCGSMLSTKTNGTGTLKFYWALSCEKDYDWFDFYLDGELVKTITGTTNWQEVVIEVVGEGDHTFEWLYWKDNIDEKDLVGANCALVDYVRWYPAGTDVVINDPNLDAFFNWLKQYNNYRVDTIEDAGRTREIGRHANGKSVSLYDEFVAGTDPEDEDSVFRATIEIVDGKPVIHWEPEEPNDGVERTYTIYGAYTPNASDDEWNEVPEDEVGESGYNFFKVEVKLKE